MVCMCMSCSPGKMSTKRKVTIFSSVGLAAITSYLTFTTTNNPAISSALPVLLSLAACPLMCAVLGGIMWFSRRSSTRNKGNSHNTQIATNSRDIAPYHDQETLQHTNKNQNENLKLLGTTDLSTNKNSKNKNIE
jgi:hypothetical protein